MHRLALKLGLTVLLHVFVVSNLLSWLPFSLTSIYVYVLGGLAISFALAFAIAPRLEPEEPPPPWATLLLIAASGVFITLILSALGVLWLMSGFRPWLLLLVSALTVRHLSPRLMLFTGVLAFALQLGLVQLAGMVGALVSLPKALIYCINLVVAVLVARWLCLREESPADRATNINLVWFFGAAGLATLGVSADGAFAYRWWMEAAVWLAFLASFLMLANHLRPDDPAHAPSALGADLVLLFMIFVALYLTTATVFHTGEVADKVLARAANYYADAWLPMLTCAVVAVAIMAGLSLGQRLRTDGPGRGALKWGTILAIVGMLAGGSILGAGEPDGKLIDFLATIVIFAVLAGPFLIAAQFLLGVGLLRMMFHLDPPRRG